MFLSEVLDVLILKGRRRVLDTQSCQNNYAFLVNIVLVVGLREGGALAYSRHIRMAGRRRSRLSRPLEYAVAAAFLIAVSVLAAALAKVSTDRHSGTALAVDGDSLKIGEIRIRLEGIDAPELRQTCTVQGRSFECGREARDHLRRLIGGRAVSCTAWQKDKFGRMLGRCTVPGVELNATMVRDGWAVAFGDFDAEEAEARAERRGMWQGEFQSPRDWRRENASAADEGGPHTASLWTFIGEIGRRIATLAGK
jgi:endonuclease YncB( thermonuclease family)